MEYSGIQMNNKMKLLFRTTSFICVFTLLYSNVYAYGLNSLIGPAEQTSVDLRESSLRYSNSLETDLPKARLDFDSIKDQENDQSGFQTPSELKEKMAKEKFLQQKEREIWKARNASNPNQKLTPPWQKPKQEVDTVSETRRLNQIAKWVHDKAKEAGSLISSYGLRYIKKGDEIVYMFANKFFANMKKDKKTTSYTLNAKVDDKDRMLSYDSIIDKNRNAMFKKFYDARYYDEGPSKDELSEYREEQKTTEGPFDLMDVEDVKDRESALAALEKAEEVFTDNWEVETLTTKTHRWDMQYYTKEEDNAPFYSDYSGRDLANIASGGVEGELMSYKEEEVTNSAPAAPIIRDVNLEYTTRPKTEEEKKKDKDEGEYPWHEKDYSEDKKHKGETILPTEKKAEETRLGVKTTEWTRNRFDSDNRPIETDRVWKIGGYEIGKSNTRYEYNDLDQVIYSEEWRNVNGVQSHIIKDNFVYDNLDRARSWHEREETGGSIIDRQYLWVEYDMLWRMTYIHLVENTDGLTEDIQKWYLVYNDMGLIEEELEVRVSQDMMTTTLTKTGYNENGLVNEFIQDIEKITTADGITVREHTYVHRLNYVYNEGFQLVSYDEVKVTAKGDKIIDTGI